MFWLEMCQYLMLLGWLTGLLSGLATATLGRKALKPSGALGVFFVIIGVVNMLLNRLADRESRLDSINYLVKD
jgi:nitrate reductase gamma subunit